MISIGLLKHFFEYLWLPLEIIELACFSEENKLYLSWKIVLKIVLNWLEILLKNHCWFSTQIIWFDYQHWKIWKFNLNRNGFKKLVRIGVIGNWDDSRRIHILFWPPWWWCKQESGSRCLDGRIGPETSWCCKLGQMLYNFFDDNLQFFLIS